MDVRVGLWRKLCADNWCFWTVVLDKTFESSMDCKEIQPVLSKGDQSWMFFGRKAMTKLDSVLKTRDIVLLTKVHIVKAMVFLGVMYGCQSWSIKKAEHWVYGFELWCWRRLLRVPWTARRSNLSILKEINPEYSLEGLLLKLRLRYLGHLMWRTTHWKRPWCWERLRAGREGGDRGWNGWMASMTQWTWVWVNSGSWWWTGKSGVLQSMGSQRVGYDWATELNWTDNWQIYKWLTF